MLVDDDRATIVYHELIIEEHGSVQKIICYNCPEKALEYLTTPSLDTKSNPDLILLDINMPRMDGWEFVEALNANLKKVMPIIMLSTTADKREYEMVKENEFLLGIKSKPLTNSVLDEILDIYFNEKMRLEKV